MLSSIPYYGISVNTDRYELQWKNAIITNPNKNASVALMIHGSYHDAGNIFGTRIYDVNQKNGYAQLMYETDITERHNLSVGASMNHDYYKDYYYFHPQFGQFIERRGSDIETTSGVYAQYTYKLDELFTLMAGLRWDRSTRYGAFGHHACI